MCSSSELHVDVLNLFVDFITYWHCILSKCLQFLPLICLKRCILHLFFHGIIQFSSVRNNIIYLMEKNFCTEEWFCNRALLVAKRRVAREEVKRLQALKLDVMHASLFQASILKNSLYCVNIFLVIRDRIQTPACIVYLSLAGGVKRASAPIWAYEEKIAYRCKHQTF